VSKYICSKADNNVVTEKNIVAVWCGSSICGVVWIKYMCCVKYLMIGCNSHSYVIWMKTNESLHFIDGFNVIFVALGIRASCQP
jgi:hypothetical protein